MSFKPKKRGAMLDFYAHLWSWLLACLVVGAATGFFLRAAPLRRRPVRWLLWAGLAFLAGAAVTTLGAAQGALALYVETALACFAAFLVGASAVSLAARGTVAAHEGWAIGLLPAALLWWGATQTAQPAYQAQLQNRVVAMAQEAGVDPAGLGLLGRDVTAPAAVAANADLVTRIAAARGVRRVIASGESPPAPENKPEDVAVNAPPSPPPTEEAKPAEVEASSDALDAAACQRALDAVADAEPVAFRAARASINRRVAFALDKAAEVIRRCPETTIEVRGHGDEGRDPGALSERRARAVERYLRREGVAGRQLVPVGCCARVANERRVSAIEFIVR